MPEEAIRINNTEPFNPNRTQDYTRDGIGFTDDKDRLLAYLTWTPQADIYD